MRLSAEAASLFQVLFNFNSTEGVMGSWVLEEGDAKPAMAFTLLMPLMTNSTLGVN